MQRSAIGYFKIVICTECDVRKTIKAIQELQKNISEKIICEVYTDNTSEIINFVSNIYRLTFHSGPKLFILLPQLTGTEYLIQPYDLLYDINLIGECTVNEFVLDYGNSFESQIYYSSYIDGTFDHLHPGHLLLLTVAALTTTKLTVGIVASEINSHKKYAEIIQPWEIRAENVRNFLKLFKKELEIEIVCIYDSVTAPVQGDFEAVITSSEPGHPIEEINKIRMALNKNLLKRVTINTIDINHKKISSSLIREKIKFSI